MWLLRLGKKNASPCVILSAPTRVSVTFMSGANHFKMCPNFVLSALCRLKKAAVWSQWIMQWC